MDDCCCSAVDVAILGPYGAGAAGGGGVGAAGRGGGGPKTLDTLRAALEAGSSLGPSAASDLLAAYAAVTADQSVPGSEEDRPCSALLRAAGGGASLGGFGGGGGYRVPGNELLTEASFLVLGAPRAGSRGDGMAHSPGAKAFALPPPLPCSESKGAGVGRRGVPKTVLAFCATESVAATGGGGRVGLDGSCEDQSVPGSEDERPCAVLLLALLGA